MRDKEFWMNYVPEGNSPMIIHESYLTAQAEAKRLAISLNKVVYILRGFERVVPPINDVQFTQLRRD